MTTDPSPTLPNVALRLVPELQSQVRKVRTLALSEMEDRFLATLQELRERPHDLELHDRSQSEAWQVVREWSLARAAADRYLPVEEIGHWVLTTQESLWVDRGFAHPGLVQEKNVDQNQLLWLVSSLFETEGHPFLEVASLTDFLQGRFRERLGVERQLESEQQWQSANGALTQLREQLSQEQAVYRQFIRDADVGPDIRTLHDKLVELAPHLARLTQLTRKGGVRDAASRRAQLKVFETARRLQHDISSSLGAYRAKKQLETMQRDFVALHMELLEREADLKQLAQELGFDGEGIPAINKARCVDAMEAALTEALELLRVVSKTPSFCPPPFLMEHVPRLTAKLVAEKLDGILENCPRLARLTERGWAKPPRVLILPGVGNACFDVKSGEVLASIFPLESRLQSISGALGEGFLHQEPMLWSGYAKAKKLERAPDRTLRESFRRDFRSWVEADRRGRTSLEREVQKWFKYEFVDRKARPPKPPANG